MATKSRSSKKTTSAAAKTKPRAKAKPAAKSKPAERATKPVAAAQPRDLSTDNRAPASLLARAEADLTTLLDSLNCHMATAVNAITELAVAQRGQHEPIVRSKPIDRATAMFQRLVTEVLDDKLGEILPTLVSLRGEMNQRARRLASSVQAGSNPAGDDDFLERGTAMLDQVLATLEVHTFEPHIGDPFDPLIHLAVGQTARDDLADGALAEVLQPGFRTARGKVIMTARVKVNRR